MKLKKPIFKKPIRKIPKNLARSMIILTAVLTAVAIFVLVTDDYTITALLVRSQTYRQSSPGASRQALIALYSISILLSPTLLPWTMYLGPKGKGKMTLRYFMADETEEIKVIRLITGKKLFVSHQRVKRYFPFLVVVYGEYQYLAQDKAGKEIILEGGDFEISTASLLEDRIRILEEELSLARHKLMTVGPFSVGGDKDE